MCKYSDTKENQKRLRFLESRNGLYFDLKCQSDPLTLIEIQFDEKSLVLSRIEFGAKQSLDVFENNTTLTLLTYLTYLSILCFNLGEIISCV